MKLVVALFTMMALLATARPSNSIHGKAKEHSAIETKREVNDLYPFELVPEDKSKLESTLNKVFSTVFQINSGRPETRPTN